MTHDAQAAPTTAGRRRVLHVVNGEVYAGAERVQDLLAHALPRHGYDVSFACIKPGLFPSRRQYRDVPLHLMPMGSRFDIVCGLKIGRLLRSGGFDIVHTHTPRSALVGRIGAAMSGLPMVHHVHSPTARDTENAMRNKVNLAMERLSLVGVSRLIAVSASLEKYLRDEEGYRNRPIDVVANGVPARGPLRDRQPPAGDWTIGTVALFRPRKGLEVLLSAMAQLVAAGRRVRLLAVGPFIDDAYEAHLRALCSSLGLDPFVEWVGFTPNVDAHFARMDVFVLPSLYGEGMPMVVLEAMAHGLPVVASDVEGIPEVVHDGVEGRIVAPGRSEALAAALEALLQDPAGWSAMRAHAHASHAARFSDEAMARGVARAYDAALLNEDRR